MSGPPNFRIHASGALSEAVRGEALAAFEQLAEYVRSLPYGRTSNTMDPLAVLRDKRGTCSSKHHLLAAVAHECGHPEVRLTVGVYEMCEQNTPGVGAVLRSAALASIPEAHCYLTVGGERFDFTGLPSGSASPFDALLGEHFVSPEALAQTKRLLHAQAMAAWAASAGVTADSAWATREACVAALTGRSSSLDAG